MRKVKEKISLAYFRDIQEKEEVILCLTCKEKKNLFVFTFMPT